jgi:hypothetical protein
MSDEKDTSFKVTDRRKFHADGTPREDAEPEASAAAEAGSVVSFPPEANGKHEPVAQSGTAAQQESSGGSAARAAAGAKAERAYDQARGSGSAHLPEASFLGLANMLGIEAAMHLGYIQGPGEDAPSIDLEAARHVIDMLGILQAKTKGNLTREEDQFLDGILADLRMRFVEISKGR